MAPAGFVLCADDYAMTPAVSRGILLLLEAGRISATGAMTNRPSWREAAPALRAFSGKADLGVHISLTCGETLTSGAGFAPNRALPKLGQMVARGMAGALPLGAIAAEITAQLASFEDAMGMAPDFVDGHQHVHAMPGVRHAFAAALSDRYPGRKPYLRDAADRTVAIAARGRFAAKALIVANLARPFAAGMRARGFRLNDGFSGYSAFNPRADLAADFRSYLVAPGRKHLVMCHPGEVDDELRALDPAIASRPKEIAYLLSAAFTATCAAAGLSPRRFAEIDA